MTIKDNILKFLGYSILIFGIFIFVIGIGMHFDEEDDKSKKGFPISVASFAFIIPGGLLLYLGRRAAKQEEQLESISSIVKSYRRITLSDIADKLNVTIPQASQLLTKAIAKKMIRGNFDRTTDEFFTEDAKAQKMEYKFCPSCGSPLDRVFLEGETVKCGSCGILIR